MMESRNDLMQLEGNQRLQSYLQVLGLISKYEKPLKMEGTAKDLARVYLKCV